MTSTDPRRDMMIAELQTCLSEQWLAYYLYWTAAQLVTGPAREAAAADLMAAAADELANAKSIASRLCRLGHEAGCVLADWQQRARESGLRHSLPLDRVLKALRQSAETAMIRYGELASLAASCGDEATEALATRLLESETAREAFAQECLDLLRPGLRRLSA